MNDLVADVIDALKIEHCAITAQIMNATPAHGARFLESTVA